MRVFANTFGVGCGGFVLTQGCSNPGLKLANAFGVFKTKPVRNDEITPHRGSLRTANTDLVEMAEQVGGVVVDAIGAGAFELFTAVAAGE